MKNTKKILLIIITLMLLTTGCTQRFTDEKTNKTYTANVMCKPSDKKTLEIYEKNKKDIDINIDKLPDCEDFQITSGDYENLFNSILVKPLAFIILKLGELVKNYGISIMIIGLFIRLLMLPITKKSLMQSENMKKAKPKLNKLEQKYKSKTDKQSMMFKSQEMMAIYKEYNISPLSGCLFAVLQLPIFFAFLEAINRIPAFFEESLLGLQLGTTPIEGMGMGQYYYLIIVVLIIATTYFSFKNMNMAAMDPTQEKTMKYMYIFMLVFIGIASFTLPIAIALYWIVSSGFSILQNIYIKKVTLKKEV